MRPDSSTILRAGGWLERAVESIRASLGADADAEIRRGRDLSVDEAADIALAVTADLD